MKEVLIDIKELTDSREMYQTKPHPFVWVFTYILIALIAAAVMWAFFGKKEIVVKANGQVRPESGISTVRNSAGGEVESVGYKQGMLVKAGDILYVIKHDSLLIEMEAQKKQLAEYNKELTNLKKYRQSIITGVNAFKKDTEPMYYEKVRKLLMDIEYTKSDTDYKITKLNDEKNVNSEQLGKNKTEMESLEKFIKSLDDSKNYLSGSSDIEKKYGQKYEDFIISKRDTQRKYDQLANDIKSNSFEALKQSLSDEKALLEAYTTLKKCVTDGENYFAAGDRYASLYTDYDFKLTSLKNTYDEQKRVYDAYVALSGIAVTKSELESARIQMEKAEGDYTTFKSNFLSDVNKTISEKQISVSQYESRVSGTMDQSSLLRLNEEDRQNSVKKLYLDERQAASDTLDKLTDSINSLKLNITLDNAELKTITDASGDDPTLDYSLIERTKSQEIVATDEKIKAANDNINTVQQNVKKLQLDIDNAVVKASIDGTVNVLSEIYPGDIVESGKEILTIIPDKNPAFTMQILVNNKDIGEIRTGDKVKYSFAALPYREYGQLTGTITNISKDAVNNQTTGQSYYVVEATVPSARLVNNEGKQGEVKVGMLCQANVITKQKSFLRYFLEKINLLD
ncbi:MAG TPA: HlyD family efflux transporter periplasmic adaptor subunit [Ruminiclostridium sp.]|nr:HlyD family efflux transporter periplasmic adaptor subunit [Ruminiclostridium sp.]